MPGKLSVPYYDDSLTASCKVNARIGTECFVYYVMKAYPRVGEILCDYQYGVNIHDENKMYYFKATDNTRKTFVEHVYGRLEDSNVWETVVKYHKEQDEFSFTSNDFMFPERFDKRSYHEKFKNYLLQIMHNKEENRFDIDHVLEAAFFFGQVIGKCYKSATADGLHPHNRHSVVLAHYKALVDSVYRAMSVITDKLQNQFGGWDGVMRNVFERDPDMPYHAQDFVFYTMGQMTIILKHTQKDMMDCEK